MSAVIWYCWCGRILGVAVGISAINQVNQWTSRNRTFFGCSSEFYGRHIGFPGGVGSDMKGTDKFVPGIGIFIDLVAQPAIRMESQQGISKSSKCTVVETWNDSKNTRGGV